MKNDIYSWHLKLKNKEVSCSELVQENIKNLQKASSNSVISDLSAQALDLAKVESKVIEQDGPSSILHGIPYTLKDLFVTKAIRTTAGSKMLYNYCPPYDGYVSQSLKKSGGILVAKVSCDEFGMGSTNESTPYGVVTNPLNSKHVAGGSSGGSAAAIAEGIGAYSIGTDTGGSARLPANFCGLVGFKPSYGMVSRFGQIAYASSLDQASPMAQSVLDIACVMDSFHEDDRRDSTLAKVAKGHFVEKLLKITPAYLKGKKIGVAQEFIEACDPLVKEQLLKALDLLKKSGCEVVDVDLKHLKYSVSTYYIIATCEASSNLARYDGIHYGARISAHGDLAESYKASRGFGFGEEVKKRIMLGTFALSSGYYDAYYTKACKVRRLIKNDFDEAFKKCDVIFSPVCSSTAFSLGSSLKDPIKMYMNDLYTIPVNLAGLPALALPFGLGENALPTGPQFIGKYLNDDELLALGRAFELASQGRSA